eukprot:723241-Pleurochrysis_carterae.AAC.1
MSMPRQEILQNWLSLSCAAKRKGEMSFSLAQSWLARCKLGADGRRVRLWGPKRTRRVRRTSHGRASETECTEETSMHAVNDVECVA